MNDDEARIGTALPPPSVPAPVEPRFAPRLPPAAPAAIPRPMEPVVQRPTFTVTVPRPVAPQRKSRRGWIVVALLVALAASAVYVVVNRADAVTSSNDPPPTNTQTIGGLSTGPCGIERVDLQTVVESWLAMHGGTTSPTESQLVEDGFLRNQSAGYDITAAGEIVPAQDGPCG
ncbi:MAG: hypothetical protein JWN62_544 [Acidimicrobiales bacterium]|nr:hypothetical protein [Acidimicrobiales bacterium]